MEKKKYWISTQGKEHGPYGKEDLQNQDLGAETLIWELGTPDWKTAKEFDWFEAKKEFLISEPDQNSINRKDNTVAVVVVALILLFIVVALAFRAAVIDNKLYTSINPDKESVTDTNVTKENDNNQITETIKGVSFEMVEVKSGSFLIGNDQYTLESVHNVTLSTYYIGKYEVTQSQWKAIMGTNPSKFKGDSLPVEQVSWNDVHEFVIKLNAKSGKVYRLPTEAEWEFAAKGGNKSRGYFFSGSNNKNDVAWSIVNSNKATHAVGTKLSNELGIYDMSGNVWEWCNDWDENYNSDPQENPTGPSSGTIRIYRGGSFLEDWIDNRICRRNFGYPACSYYNLGFRLVLTK